MRFLLTSSNYSKENTITGINDCVVEKIKKHNEKSEFLDQIHILENEVINFHGFAKKNYKGFNCLFVEIHSIEALERLQNVTGYPLIIDFDGYDNTPEIEIYNGYRE